MLILGPQGVAAAAAAGVLLTATGTVGGLLFAAWGALDMGLSHPRGQLLPTQLRRSVERACFDVVGHLEVGPMLLPAYAPGLPPRARLTAR